MKTLCLILISFFSVALYANENIKNEEPLKVQEELRPPTQKFTQAVVEKRVRDNLFKKEEKEEKEAVKKE